MHHTYNTEQMHLTCTRLARRPPADLSGNSKHIIFKGIRPSGAYWPEAWRSCKTAWATCAAVYGCTTPQLKCYRSLSVCISKVAHHPAVKVPGPPFSPTLSRTLNPTHLVTPTVKIAVFTRLEKNGHPCSTVCAVCAECTH